MIKLQIQYFFQFRKEERTTNIKMGDLVCPVPDCLLYSLCLQQCSPNPLSHRGRNSPLILTVGTCTKLHCTILHYTILNCTLLHSTALY